MTGLPPAPPSPVPARDWDGLWRDATQHLTRYGATFHPQFITRARGSWLWDQNGRAILDFTSGQMCATIGHNHPAIIEAITKSAQEVVHLFSGMLPPQVPELARRIADLCPSPLQKVLLLNTGGEVNEAGLKMAKMRTGGFEVIGLGGSWHGTSSGAGAHTYAGDRRGYGPGMPGTLMIPEPNAYQCPVRHCRDACDMTCLEVGFNLVDQQSVGAGAAVIAEPILSAGGIIVPPPGYLKRLKEMCEQRGLLLIIDEAQTAFGRVGATFCFEQEGVVPDILSLSKTLGGGLPLAASVTSAEIEEDVHRKGYAHYTSHVSDPLPAAVGLAVLDILAAENLAENARVMGARFTEGLRSLQQRWEIIGDIRGRGLMIGVELVKDRESRRPDHALGLRITQRALELGLNMNIRTRPTRGSVWRIAPPLTVNAEEIDLALEMIDQAIRECHADRNAGGGGAWA
ncbi:MAG: aspartate aminotransferase family protein [Alphaproteobacteria bacterium]|nr:aspartate aminotransferase family protein [Alphaproteobacteria bacterium]